MGRMVLVTVDPRIDCVMFVVDNGGDGIAESRWDSLVKLKT